ncbi:MAG: putative Type phosphodiesterase/nucleotide pyrophosphatase [Acidimicrobiales bacterium]|nr:putative Type phosphodiesterase/nucleotide pyrophosphatase [Acidimicrobiales bacterium]
MPALLAGVARSWLPARVVEAPQVVLLCLDGLGFEQLKARPHLATTMAAMEGGPITSVAPSTTATALASLVTGSPPAVHGIVGYRVKVGPGEVLNVLRWRTQQGDARERIRPDSFVGVPPFQGAPVPVVTRAEFADTGFTAAHLRGTRLVGWRMPSTLVSRVRSLLRSGERFVYAYYDGVDKVAHEFGLGEEYEAEVTAADQLVDSVAAALPPGAALVVTSDHGQVDVGDGVEPLTPGVIEFTTMLSGEGRFRWLHARPGMAGHLLDAAESTYGARAWVRSIDAAEAENWFGGALSDTARGRLGDVAVAVHEPIALLDPADTGEVHLRSRHGSLTSAEMLVPLLVHVA